MSHGRHVRHRSEPKDTDTTTQNLTPSGPFPALGTAAAQAALTRYRIRTARAAIDSYRAWLSGPLEDVHLNPATVVDLVHCTGWLLEAIASEPPDPEPSPLGQLYLPFPFPPAAS